MGNSTYQNIQCQFLRVLRRSRRGRFVLPCKHVLGLRLLVLFFCKPRLDAHLEIRIAVWMLRVFGLQEKNEISNESRNTWVDLKSLRKGKKIGRGHSPSQTYA